MVILGAVLAVLGYLFGLNWLWVIGVILLVIGAVFWILGAMGRSVGGRKVWY